MELKYHGSFHKSLFSLIRSKWALNLICGWLDAFLLNSQNSSNLSNFMNFGFQCYPTGNQFFKYFKLKIYHRSVTVTAGPRQSADYSKSFYGATFPHCLVPALPCRPVRTVIDSDLKRRNMLTLKVSSSVINDSFKSLFDNHLVVSTQLDQFLFAFC